MSANTDYRFDRAFIDRVAAIVVERLRALSEAERSSQANSTEPFAGKIVDAEVVANRPPGSTLLIRSDAIVTPLAKDTAADRRVQLQRIEAIRATT